MAIITKEIENKSVYVPVDDTEYNDTWQQPIGADCAKKLDKKYIFNLNNR